MQRADRALLAAGGISSLFWALAVATLCFDWLWELADRGFIGAAVEDGLYNFAIWIVLLGPAVALFCFQLVLCRRVRKKPAALILSGLVAVPVGCCLAGMATATGWDGLGWIMLLFLAGSALAGCVLAWGAYGLWRLKERRS